MSAHALNQPLPPEITDMIIDYLHRDKAALASCSFVSRSWIPSTRYHLFERIILQPSNIDTFVSLRASPYCSIAPHPRRLVLSLDITTGARIFSCLGQLSSVKSLYIERDARWLGATSKSAGAFASFVGSFPTLTKLKITGVYFNTLVDVTRLICAFPCLHVLRLRDVAWLETEYPSSCAPSDNLQTLDIEGPHKWRILNSILYQHPALSLRTLNLGTISSENIRAVGNCIRQYGSSLENVGFGFPGMDGGRDAEDFYTHVDLGRCPRLRLIRIQQFIFYENPRRRSSAINWIPLILKRATSPHIQEVQFTVFCDSLEQLDPNGVSLDWCTYDQLFTLKSLSTQIKRLIFVIYGSINGEDARREIRRRLPLCTAQGILYFILQKYYVNLPLEPIRQQCLI